MSLISRVMPSISSSFMSMTEPAPGHLDQVKEQFKSGLPLGRYGQPEEVADVMLFLASDQSRYCTGGVYMADGGVSAT